MRLTDRHRQAAEDDLAVGFAKALDYVQRRVVERVRTAATTLVAAGDVRAFEYDESLHPRDEHGRWGDGGGESKTDGGGRGLGGRAPIGDVIKSSAVADMLTGKVPMEELGRGSGAMAGRWGGVSYGEHGDPILGRIAAVSGAAGKPVVGSPAEVDAAIRGGGVEVFRGVVGFKGEDGKEVTPTEIQDQFRNGETTRWGAGSWGNGVYFGSDQATGGGYAASDPGALVRAAIFPDAKVGTYQQVEAERRAFVDANYNTNNLDYGSLLKMPPEQADAVVAEVRQGALIFGDTGAYAMAAGYDAYTVDGTSEVVVLNRSALIVEKGQ
jgi:hypothetical protein